MAFTFGGASILGSGYDAITHPGILPANVEDFKLPGVWGQFEHRMAPGARVIVVEAVIRADDGAGLASIHGVLDALIGDAEPKTLVDGLAQSYDLCSLREAVPLSRRELLADGKYRQELRLTFVQLAP